MGIVENLPLNQLSIVIVMGVFFLWSFGVFIFLQSQKKAKAGIVVENESAEQQVEERLLRLEKAVDIIARSYMDDKSSLNENDQEEIVEENIDVNDSPEDAVSEEIETGKPRFV